MSRHWLLATVLLALLAGNLLAQGPQPPAETPRLVAQTGYQGDPFLSAASIAIAPNGRWVATFLHTELIIWEAATGREICRRDVDDQNRTFRDVSFDPSSSTKVLLSAQGYKVIDWQTGAVSAEIRSRLVSWVPGGKQLLAEAGAKLYLWDIASKKKVREFALPGNVDRFAVSWDGQFAACVTGAWDKKPRLSVFQMSTGQRLQEFFVEHHALSIEFSPDGKQLLVHDDRDYLFLYALTGARAVGPVKSIRQARFLPDGKRLLVSEPKTGDPVLLDLATLQPVRTFKGVGVEDARSRGGRFTQALSHDGSLLAGLRLGRAFVWDTATGKQLSQFRGHRTRQQFISFLANETRLLTMGDRLHVWDLSAGREVARFGESHFYNLCQVSFDKKWCITVLALQGQGRLWDLETYQEKTEWRARIGTIDRACFSTRQPWLVASNWTEDKTRLWDVSAGRMLAEFPGKFVGFKDEDRKIATSLGLFESRTGRPLLSTEKVLSPYDHIWSEDGRRVLLDESKYLAVPFRRLHRLIDIETGKELATIRDLFPTFREFSPDSKYLAVHPRDDRNRTPPPLLFDARTGKKLRDFAEFDTPKDDPVLRLEFSSESGKGWILKKTATVLIDLRDGHILQNYPLSHFVPKSSPGGKYHVAVSYSGYRRKAALWERNSDKLVTALFADAASEGCLFHFSSDGRWLVSDNLETLEIRNLDKDPRETLQLISFEDKDSWAVLDNKGRYDASNGGDVEGLHWVVNHESVSLDQLKERYYDPGLLAKFLGLNKEPLRKVEAFTAPKLFPDIQIAEPTRDNPKLGITLTDRGGGIGRVVVKLNGKEITADARPKDAQPDANGKLTITLDLSGNPLLKRGEQNAIEVQAFNAEGYLRSRGMQRLFEAEGKKEQHNPEVWAIVAGVSKYQGETINLRYAAKDAEDFAKALQLAAGKLFGPDKVRLTLLTSLRKDESSQPTRENLVKALQAARKAKPDDVVVLYLSGHGVNHGGADKGDFYYLTADAQSADLTDPEVRQQVALSSQDLADLIRQIPAQKQVLILDTCAAGRAVEKLTHRRNVPGSQVRALERVKDATGLHILAGCASDAVCYEASRYGQGLLTYSLLLGMKGAALREEQFVDVGQLFGFASDRVPELAKDIGGIQRPVIASPKGVSFAIGQLTRDDKSRIPLTSPRPLLLRPLLFNPDELDDTLGLMPLLRDKLTEATTAGGRDGSSAVYVDADEMPGAIRPTGAYQVEGNKIKVRLALRQDGKTLATFEVEGSREKLPQLVSRMAEKIVTELNKVRGE